MSAFEIYINFRTSRKDSSGNESFECHSERMNEKAPRCNFAIRFPYKRLVGLQMINSSSSFSISSLNLLTMKSHISLLVLPLIARAAVPTSGPDGKYTLMAESITAKFLPYAACITNLMVSDCNNVRRDIILGYDNASLYLVGPNHPDYGAVSGRYINRIANHTYLMDGVRHYTDSNGGNGTLRSGLSGWSRDSGT